MTAIPNAPGALAPVFAEFDRCWPWLEDAMRRGGNLHTRDSIWLGILTGNFQFWPYPRAAGVTHIDVYPNGKLLRLWLAGGELDEVLAHEQDLAEWAQSIGCIGMQLVGRKGWEKALGAAGYQRGDIILTRGFNNVAGRSGTG